MDFDDYWQENKDFVAKVAVGLIVFLIGVAVVNRTVGAKVEAERRSVNREQSKLRQEASSGADISSTAKSTASASCSTNATLDC